ncbi:MAG: DNA-processing protein DprA [Candidatus Omnitrophota bacterium]
MPILQTADQARTISFQDADYPKNLKFIYHPPALLYIKGSILPDDSIALAIVGSRRATYYGLHNAEKLAFELASRGIVIVSGLARGIDSAAHRGALKAGGRTIAVLGSGLNRIYPAENAGLAEQISHHGAVISEFSPDSPPLRHNFPRRNRIISGLSLGVIVVEAAKRSGALLTANFALEQGREVFAFPGNIDSWTSCGTHGLIKQGAKLVESTEDIIEELEPLKSWPKIAAEEETRHCSGADNPSEKSMVFTSAEEKEIYACLTTPLYIDELIQKTRFSYGKIMISILTMAQKKLVRELPGKMFSRT